jgi:cell division protein FtsI/penicillin-binding protein 2
MLTDTTLRGTARRAFRKRNGRPLLGPVTVAGKTGSLSGTDPTGRYEWFAGVAPADQPRIAVAVLVVQSDRWWRNASQIAAEVLQGVFCEGRDCRPELSARWIRPPTVAAAKSGYAAEVLN